MQKFKIIDDPRFEFLIKRLKPGFYKGLLIRFNCICFIYFFKLIRIYKMIKQSYHANKGQFFLTCPKTPAISFEC